MSGLTVAHEAFPMVSRAWPNWLLLAGLVMCGALLRFRHLEYVSRLPMHPDEPITVEVVNGMRVREDWNTNWKLAGLEETFRRDQFNFSGYLIAARLFAPAAEVIAGPLQQRRDRGVVWYRGFSAAFGIGCIVFAWLLGKAVGDTWTALFSAAGTAVAVILVQDAHYARPEAFSTFLFLAVAWISVRRTPASAASLAIAGFLVGVLTMTKVTLAIAAIFPLWAWLQTRPAEPSHRGRWWLIGGGALLATSVGLGVAAPAAWSDLPAFMRGLHYLRNQYASAHVPHSRPDHGRMGLAQLAYFGGTLGLGTAVLALAGSAMMLAKRQWTVIITVLFTVLVTAGYFATQHVFFERNLSHVVPLYFLAAGLGLAAIVSPLERRIHRRWISASIGALVVALALLPAVRLTYRFVEIDLSGQAAERLRAYSAGVAQRCPPNTRILVTSLLSDEVFEQVRQEVQSADAPLLLSVIDFNDPYTALQIKRLPEVFDVLGQTRFDGIYGDLPVCTLHTYHGHPVSFWLIQARP